MLTDILKAFIVGGIICVIGQFLIDYTKLTPARILTGYVVTGVILSALGVYQYFVDFAGAGASVPLVGFGHLLADGVKKAVQEDGFLGVFKGGLLPRLPELLRLFFSDFLHQSVSNSVINSKNI